MNGLNDKKTLLIGIGNSGRSDDGLGWAFTEAVDQRGWFEGEIIQRYQLQIEDAELISQYEQVVFADACQIPLPEGFELKRCFPSNNFSFSTHELAPETVLQLCKDLYKKLPQAYLLLIRGKEWNLKVGLSTEAISCLEKALGFFECRILHPV